MTTPHSDGADRRPIETDDECKDCEHKAYRHMGLSGFCRNTKCECRNFVRIYGRRGLVTANLPGDNSAGISNRPPWSAMDRIVEEVQQRSAYSADSADSEFEDLKNHLIVTHLLHCDCNRSHRHLANIMSRATLTQGPAGQENQDDQSQRTDSS